MRAPLLALCSDCGRFGQGTMDLKTGQAQITLPSICVDLQGCSRYFLGQKTMVFGQLAYRQQERPHE